jgi:hypothetical protein
MRDKSSISYIVIILTFISFVIGGIIAGCDDKKHIHPPVLGPAAGSGPIGGGDTQSIQLIASPSGMIRTVPGTPATVTITALIENQIGQPMPDGTAVYWSSTVGTLSSTTTTSSNGSSTVTLTFPDQYDGCSWITAKSGDVEASIEVCTTSVTPTPTVTPAPTVAPTATPSKVFIVSAANFIISHNGTTTVTAHAETDGRPDVNLQVNFSVSGAGILSANAGVTNSSGNATVTLTGYNTSTSDQTATVVATTVDGRSGSITIIVTTPTPTP